MGDEEKPPVSNSDTNVPVSCEQCEEPATFSSLRKLVAHMKCSKDHYPMCNKCDVTFKNYHNFGAHIRLYHIQNIKTNENLEFPCEVCGKCYKTKHLLNNHCNIVHKIEENLRCNLCEKPYQNIKKLKIHTLKCLIKAPQFEEYYRKEVLMREKEDSSKPKVDELQTKLIMFDYTVAPDFVEFHKDKMFNQNKTESTALFETTKSEIKTENSANESSDNDIRDNVTSENDNSENENSEDDMLTYGVAHLVESKLKDLKDDDERKEECKDNNEVKNERDYDWIKLEEDTEFDDNTALNNHNTSFDTVPSSIRKKILIKSKKDRTPRPIIICPVCNAEVKHLNAHMKDKHPGVPQSYSCKECSKVFDCRRKWYMHAYSCKHEPCLCDICSQIFKNARNLKQHKRQVHEKRPGNPKRNQPVREPKICPICAKSVVYLNGHMRDVHSDKPDGIFPCSECGKIYVSKKKLNDHCITAHREDPKMCTVCSTVFKNGHALRGHMRTIHEDKTEHTCPICFKTFETKMKMYGHNRIVHQRIRSVPVKCNPCGVTYKNKTLLKSHQRESPWCQERLAEYDLLK